MMMMGYEGKDGFIFWTMPGFFWCSVYIYVCVCVYIYMYVGVCVCV